MATKSLKGRVRRLEAPSHADPRRALPIIVPVEELDGERAKRLRDRGYVVVTFEQCAEEMV